jgi:hypothetical protein
MRTATPRSDRLLAGLRRLAIVVPLLAIGPVSPSAAATPARPVVTVYHSPTCGCCGKWIDHMKRNGFTIVQKQVTDVIAVKKRLGVPMALASCHTSVVGGYAIEGHVPADVITKLLREKPAVAGIGVPGMPAGVPGMETAGPRDRYEVVAFTKTGQRRTYALR